MTPAIPVPADPPSARLATTGDPATAGADGAHPGGGCHKSATAVATTWARNDEEGPVNNVQLIGRLTHDPDADHTPGGTAVTTFRLAVDRPGRSGADFVTIKTWDRLAQAAADHLTRGRRVAVQGRLTHQEWTGSDGRRAEQLTVVADRVEFLDRPKGSRGGRHDAAPDEPTELDGAAAVDTVSG